MVLCLFNNFWAVPLELFEKIDFKRQKFLYFMRYGFDKIYSELIWVFEINEDFIINYKAFKTFLEYKKFEKENENMEPKTETSEPINQKT
jgi:hypothetical protein